MYRTVVFSLWCWVCFLNRKQRLLSAQVPTATWMREGIWRDVLDQLKANKSCCCDAVMPPREDCSLHVFERPVKPLTDPMLHNGQVPTRHEMLILGGVFYCPADRPCAMFVLGRCLAVSCSFLLPLGGRIGKLSFCILLSWIHRVDDEDQFWATSPKRLTETWFWGTARFCYQGWAGGPLAEKYPAPTPSSFSSTKTRQLPKSSQFPDFSWISLKCLADCPARSTVPLKNGSYTMLYPSVASTDLGSGSFQILWPCLSSKVCLPTRDHYWHLGWSGARKCSDLVLWCQPLAATSNPAALWTWVSTAVWRWAWYNLIAILGGG